LAQHRAGRKLAELHPPPLRDQELAGQRHDPDLAQPLAPAPEARLIPLRQLTVRAFRATELIRLRAVFVSSGIVLAYQQNLAGVGIGHVKGVSEDELDAPEIGSAADEVEPSSEKIPSGCRRGPG